MEKEKKITKSVSSKPTKKKSTTKKTVQKKSVQKKPEIVGNEIFNEIKPNKSKYISYSFRLGTFGFFFALFIFLSIFLIISSITLQNAEFINYSEKGVLDYKVNLKPNNFYETKTLDKNMIYVASLIDSIDTYFKYNFRIDEKVNLKFTYDVVAQLQITDESGNNTYLTKDYTLLKNREIILEKDDNFSVEEKVNINYGYYNNIATGFKSTYGVNSKSNLIVTLKVNKSTNDETKTILNSTTIQQFKIPLSERSVNIKLDYTDIDSRSFVINEEDVLINSNIKIAAGIICLLIGIYFALKCIKLIEKTYAKPNAFDKYVNKILKTYDRLIVESRNAINFDDKEIIRVNRFEELLDVRDNLKLPINYYVITPHQKANFYIISTHIYLYTVKEVDLNKK